MTNWKQEGRKAATRNATAIPLECTNVEAFITGYNDVIRERCATMQQEWRQKQRQFNPTTIV